MTIILVLSILLNSGEFVLHMEKHFSNQECQRKVQEFTKKLESATAVQKYAVECFGIKDQGV